ncbi:MAG: HD domain-containing protein [Rhodocyclales bacterium]|nr:HD domain-containing protein [Rhodocyclales bacterium]
MWQKLHRGHIRLGEPLPWPVYDAQGHLLLRKGAVLTIPGQVDALAERGLFVPETSAVAPPPEATPTPESKEPVLTRLQFLGLRLKRLFDAVEKTQGINLPEKITHIARDIQEAVAEDFDAALAAVHLDFEGSYVAGHSLHGAILCEILARSQTDCAADRLPFLCAALTRDIGVIAPMEQAAKIEGPLPDPLRAAIRTHAQNSRRQLEQAGVRDTRWLEAVLHHHERLDGSGYPNGLAGEAVSLGGRLLAIADSYSAMTKERAWRAPVAGKRALGNLFLDQGKQYDTALVQGLVKEMGVFPPGTLVRLESGEIAVVHRRRHPGNPAQPIVYSLYDRQGIPLVAPLKRDTSVPQHAITGLLHISQSRSAATAMKRLWQKAA